MKPSKTPGLPDGGSDGSGGQASGTGSGFFVSSGGDIITNNHVVEGASEITIRLHGSKQTYKAKGVARAPDFDLALIRAEGVPAQDINPLPLGDSERLDVGLKAIAMGAPFGLDFSVSEGIISSLERTVPVGTQAVQALRHWLAVRTQLAADDPGLFVGRGGRRLSADAVRLRLRRPRLGAGLATPVHPHMLRHSFASHVLQSSGDLRAVQELLGHANIATTQVYTRLDFQHLAKAYDAAHPRAHRRK